jgi:hypothetical protein
MGGLRNKQRNDGLAGQFARGNKENRARIEREIFTLVLEAETSWPAKNQTKEGKKGSSSVSELVLYVFCCKNNLSANQLARHRTGWRSGGRKNPVCVRKQ